MNLRMNRLITHNSQLKTKKGFALVEVLLVASLLSLVLVTIFASYTSGFRLWQAITKLGLAKDQNLSVGMEKIKNELPGFLRDFPDIEFEGSKKKISFPVIQNGEILEITYEFKKSKHSLLRKEVMFSDSLGKSLKETVSRVLHADDVNFSFFVLSDTKQSGSWITNFSAEDAGPPEAVKLDLRIDGEKITKIIFMPK